MTDKIDHMFIMQNTLADILQRTDALVEATRFEQLCLWEKYSVQNNSDKPDLPHLFNWEEFSGKMQVVNNKRRPGMLRGVVADPICINVSFSLLNNKLVGFWEATSQLVDYVIIYDWFQKHTSNNIRMVDAMNFYNIE